jgi:hypothetical protein
VTGNDSILVINLRRRGYVHKRSGRDVNQILLFSILAITVKSEEKDWIYIIRDLQNLLHLDYPFPLPPKPGL